MAWLNYLIDGGFLNPEKNPEPVAVDKGFIIPRWEPLAYLEKLADSFEKGENADLIGQVLEIINNVSKNPRDNYHTWYTFIKILTKIPNEKIPAEILEFIPVWLSGKFDTMLQSSEIIGKLLPKFLVCPNETDIQKAEIITKHLFDLEPNLVKDPLNAPLKSYYSRIYKYYFKQAFVDLKLAPKIAAHLSPNIISIILDRVNLLLRDYAITASVINGNDKYLLHLIPNDKDLRFKVQAEENSNGKLQIKTTIKDYIVKSPKAILGFITKELNKVGITDEISRKEAIDRISFNLQHDLYSLMTQETIQDLQDDTYHDDDLIHLFAFALREILSEFSIQRVVETISILDDLTQKQEFDLPFFKRLTFYVLAKNWKELKYVFFKMIGNNDPSQYFSNYYYEHELHYLLRTIQLELSVQESKQISDILSIGFQARGNDKANPEVWKHRWLDALKGNPYFKKEYDQITQKHGLGKTNYAEEGKVKVMVGNVSPFSYDEILKMEDHILLNEIMTFKNHNRFDDPTVEGFAEQLMKAAEIQPKKFINNIANYKEVSYLYIYYILLGITTAWKNKISFDWNKLLTFCFDYINSELFNSNRQTTTDTGLRAKKEWVAGTIGRLISEGTRNDENAFDHDLLPKTKEIILKLVKDLMPDQRKIIGESYDYPMHSLNSTAGQVLRGLLDYSLRKARLGYPEQSTEPKWEKEIKEAYNSTLTKQIIDSNILIGMYFQQFYYLDKAWTEIKVNDFYELSGESWVAFMGGLGFTSPVWSQQVYDLLHPHYKRAITTDGAIDTHYNHGLIRHISAYYLWNFEKLEEKSLINDLIQYSEPKKIKELIHFISQQHRFLKKYSLEEQQNLKAKAIVIWKKILERVNKDSFPEREDLLENLLSFTDYFDHLTVENVSLILQSLSSAKDYHSLNDILATLARLRNNTTDTEAPRFIASILEKFEAPQYLHDEHQKLLKDLIIYLFENGESDVASYLCNKLTIQGYDFLREVFYKYKNR